MPEYWIIRPANRDLLRYTQPDPRIGTYLQTSHIAPDADIVSPTLPFRAPVARFVAGSPDETL